MELINCERYHAKITHECCRLRWHMTALRLKGHLHDYGCKHCAFGRQWGDVDSKTIEKIRKVNQKKGRKKAVHF